MTKSSPASAPSLLMRLSSGFVPFGCVVPSAMPACYHVDPALQADALPGAQTALRRIRDAARSRPDPRARPLSATPLFKAAYLSLFAI